MNFNFLKDISKEALGHSIGEITGDFALGFLKNGKTLEVVAKRLDDAVEMFKNKLRFQEKRSEFWGFITTELAARDSFASQAWIRRQQERNGLLPKSYNPTQRYEPGDENKLSEAGTRIFVSLHDEDEQGMLLEMLTCMGHMNDADFDAMVEAMIDDRFKQTFKLLLKKTNDFFQEAACIHEELNDWLEDQKSVKNLEDPIVTLKKFFRGIATFVAHFLASLRRRTRMARTTPPLPPPITLIP